MSRVKGNAAEEKACEHLKNEGFTIVARNVYFKGGEIDIVAEKGGVIHFVEVKSGRAFEPVYNVTPRKIARIVRGAQWWLKRRGIDAPWQIDVIAVRGEACERLPNVTI